MQFGISFLPDAEPNAKPADEYFADALALSEVADKAGMHSVKMTEHYLHPYGGYCPSPLSFLSAVAARTNQIRLLTGGILPAFHHPIQIASTCAMVDALSMGRLEVGFARAYLPYEFESFGVPLDESRERFVQTVRAVIRLWTELKVTFDCRYFTFRDATSLPRTTQKPHPPVWGTAVQSRQSFAWLGQEGFNLMVTPSLSISGSLAEYIAIYRETFQDHHGPSKVGKVAISLPLYVADSDEKAFLEGDHYMQRCLRVWANATDSWSRVQSIDYPGYTGMAQAIRSISPESMRNAGSAVMGCPSRALDAIHSLQEKLAVDVILWQVDFGYMPGEVSMRNLQMFLDKVLPRIH